MSRQFFVLCLLGACALSNAQQQTHPRDIYDDAPKTSIAFWANPSPYYVIDTDGELRADVQYVSDGAEPRAFICRNGRVTYQLASIDTTLGAQDTIHRLDMSFSGEDFLAPDATAFVLREPVRHIYLPHTLPNGVENIHAFEQILYENLYAGIDLWFYSGATGQKMMLVFNPGSDPNDLRLLFEGQDEMTLDVYGNLRLLLDGKEITLPQAVAYQLDQYDNIIPVGWTAEFVPNGNTGQVGFTFNSYDPTKRLILLFGPPPFLMDDPVQTPGYCWSTFLGGAQWDYFQVSEQDAQLNLYVAGTTFSDFFTYGEGTGSTVVENPDGLGTQAIVHKFDPLHELVWSTYLGGSQRGTSAQALSVRQEVGNPLIYVGGQTLDDDLYTLPALNAYNQATASGELWHGWLGKLRHTGQILWSTYFGDDQINISSMDHMGHSELYVTGIAASELPAEQVSPPINAMQQPYAGVANGDMYIARFNYYDQLDWTTCYGSTASEAGNNLRCMSNKFVLQGLAYGPGIPLVPGPAGSYQHAYVGGVDMHLAEFTAGGVLLWNTYLGGTGNEGGGVNGLDVHAYTGDMYLIGTSNSSDLPYESGPGWNDATPQGNQSFIAKFQGSDRDLVWLANVDGRINSEVWQGTWLNTVRILPTGGVITAGLATEDPATGPIPYVPYPGVWSSDEAIDNAGANYNQFNDGVVMVFDAGLDLVHSTFVGGEGGSNGESLRTLSVRGWPEVVFAGSTCKNELPTYFPLWDPGGDAWYDPYHNSYYYDDGWLLSLCYAEEFPVGVPVEGDSAGTRLWMNPYGLLHYEQHPENESSLEVHGADGRMVWRGTAKGAAGAVDLRREADLRPGTYAVKCATTVVRFVLAP